MRTAARNAQRPSGPLHLDLLSDDLTPGVLLMNQSNQLPRRLIRQQILELRPEVRHEAHTLDHEVDDLPLAVHLPEPIVDEDVVAPAAARDLRLHGDVASRFLAIADDLDLLVLVAVDAVA